MRRFKRLLNLIRKNSCANRPMKTAKNSFRFQFDVSLNLISIKTKRKSSVLEETHRDVEKNLKNVKKYAIDHLRI